MPAYNAAKTIKNSINTVLMQTYKNWELIIVDDGSTDETEQFAKEYANENIVFLRQENEGPASARNKGIAKARGEYITFMDSDDEIHQEYIKVLVDLLEQNSADISMCEYCKITINEAENLNKQIKEKLPEGKLEIFSPEECIQRMFYKNKVMPYPFLKLFKRSVIGEVKFPYGIKLGEDLEFNLGVFKRSKKIVYVDLPLYFHITNYDGITHNLNQQVAEEHWHRMENLYIREEEILKPAIMNRLFVLSFDFLCQMEKENNGQKFYKVCYDFIQAHNTAVYEDRKASFVVRIMAFMSKISIPLTVQICKCLKNFNLKKAV